MPGTEQIWTIVVGAGSGHRFGSAKQFEPLGDQRVIDRSRQIAAQASHGVVTVVAAEFADREQAVAGGATRSESVRAGLAHVPEEATIICVHDAARPLATALLYERVIAAVAEGADAAVPGVAVADTIKIVEDGIVTSTPDRDTLVAVQTPQAFRAQVLRAVHERGGIASDDAAMVEALDFTVRVVEGDPGNRKITLPEDLEWAQRQLAGRSSGRSSRSEP